MSGRRPKPPTGRRETYAKELGQMLRDLRIQAGYSNPDISSLSGLSMQVISTIENGDVEASLFEILAYCRGLGVDSRDLLVKFRAKMEG